MALSFVTRNGAKVYKEGSTTRCLSFGRKVSYTKLSVKWFYFKDCFCDAYQSNQLFLRDRSQESSLEYACCLLLNDQEYITIEVTSSNINNGNNLPRAALT